MQRSRISQLVRIRHFEEADIPLRMEVMNDANYMANIRDTALHTGEQEIIDWHLQAMEGSPPSVLFFTACTRKGAVLGFTWVHAIDWDRPHGQMSVAMVPKYRSGWGYAAVQATSALLFDEYNFHTITTQVFTHNTMMSSDEWTSSRSDVSMPYFSFTGGEFRHSRFWTESRSEHYYLERLV